MQNIEDVVTGIYSNLEKLWTVEWWLDEDGIRHFHVGDLKNMLQNSADNYRDSKKGEYQLLGVTSSIEQAHWLIGELKKTLPTGNIVPLRPR